MLFILCVPFLITSVLKATDYVKWFYNYDVGHKEALRLEKPIMLFLKDDTSSESIKMFKNTFSNKKVIGLINKSFIPIQLQKGSDRFPLELYYTLEFPALFFATRYEILYNDIFTGYIEPEKLIKKITQYKDAK